MSRCLNEPIAVVGSACRFAGDATSPSKLWDRLQAPVDLLQEIPTSRFNPRGFYHQNGAYHGHTNVRHAYLLDQDLAVFDAEFFGVKPVEAKAMDPQQRILLEVVYEGLEAAGLTLSGLRGSDTGVYVGVMFNDYATMLLRDFQVIPTYFATGTGQSILSNRISHFYDWHGPSVTVDTACSSSLVAVHLAVQALRSNNCRVALACGTNLIIGPEGFIIESKLNMLSPDGRSRMWDRNANGYARGEGVASVVLKTLSAALEDHDHIECIIRETGLNQDGATAGITMPSASAQEALIRRTYATAGLDLLKPSDRPQYFEAHGTGTPAGDPKEAEAIYRAFYTSSAGEAGVLDGEHPLYVGSIKTVLGHTEGTAGVAALIKASLALQRRTIPPNLLFEELSDSIEPFYKGVEILRTARAWPPVEQGRKRRVSVNSFGFGGANAHAIVESYDEAQTDLVSSPMSIFTPFVFSALSETSLRGCLLAYTTFLEHASSNVNPRDLAWTLRQRRSLLPYRIYFVASSLFDLREKIAARLEEHSQGHGLSLGIKALSSSASEIGSFRGVLGVFTGQGAQYARMGAALIEESPTARKIIQELESHLAEISIEKDRPSWSLETELRADASSSRINEAELSQPLCTALQILLVDLLKLAGVHFSAVVGHSSGEIAAAYAAGYLSARDAMLIAYYRGRHASLAASPNGPRIRGAMIAVGSSMEDIEELCSDERFAGRLVVAASNSPSSVTVSGDVDAIAELEDVLDDEEKFHRRLKVDHAYHSNHMGPCFGPYVASLQGLGITPRVPPTATSCAWFSSVDNGQIVDQEEVVQRLSDVYWAENFTKPVLFSQAVSAALSTGSYDLVLEVGPHPALKGPTMETIQRSLNKDLPYEGVLSRSSDAVSTFSVALGFLWSYLAGKESVDLDKYERAMAGFDSHSQCFRIVKGLPTYQWSHKVRYWHEARSSRKTRLRAQPAHPLLGDTTPDSAPHHLQWRNLLQVSEMEWLSSHCVHGQPVFPAAGFLAAALEASHFVVDDATVRLVEMSDFAIHRAIPFEDADAGIEVLIEMSDITRHVRDNAVIRAKFTYSAAVDAQSDDLRLAASADMVIHLGQPSLSLLPRRGPALPHTIDVEPERFYSALRELGYYFDGRFRALTSLRRRRGRASCLVKMPPPEAPFIIHPAELDAMLQSAFLAYSYPYDEELRTLHLPTTIRRIRINPAALRDGEEGRCGQEELVPVDSSIAFGVLGQKAAGNITANVNLYATSRTAFPHAAIQVQGVSFVPIGGEASQGQDRLVYSKERWVLTQPDGIEAARGLWEDEEIRRMARLLERVATFYLRKFNREVPPEHPARTTFPTKWYLNHARHVSEMVNGRKHIWWEREWDQDTVDSILELTRPYMHLPDFQIMNLVGTQMPRVFEGETTMLEQFRSDGNDILDRYYAEGTITKHLANWVARAIKQIVDRHPHMNILEVGAGTGGATKAILNEIGDSFSSYTYTDISAGFFENASSVFSQYGEKMVFKTLDVEKDPVQQGYAEATYDLVIAFFVIHATSDLEHSLHNIRKLLKPGGFLAIGEGADNGTGTATSGFIFGTLPGWWIGTEKGRVLTPLISAKEWDALLRSAGFSGADATPSFSDEDVFNVFPVVSQAVDDRIHVLREPIAATSCLDRIGVPPIQKLIVVGGQSIRSSRLIKGLIDTIRSHSFAVQTYHFEALTDIDFDLVDDGSTVVSLTDLDTPVFQDITIERFDALKSMFGIGKTALWVTSGRQGDEPFANMMVGFARCAGHETSGLRLQQVDIVNPESVSPATIAEILLRLHVALALKEDGNSESDIFWTIEPEIIIDSQGRQLVPRLGFIAELNGRYNSGHRPVIRELDINKAPRPIRLQLEYDQKVGQHYVLREVSRYETEVWEHAHSSKGWLELHATHAVLSAIKTGFGYKFLVRGVEVETGQPYFALAPSLSSKIRVPLKHAVYGKIGDLSDEDSLRAMAAHLVALSTLNTLYSGQTLLAHNVKPIIAEALAIQAKVKDVEVIYTTDLTDAPSPTSWVKLPQYLGESELYDTLALVDPPDAFVGFSNYKVVNSVNEDTLISSLGSRGTIIMTADSMYSPSASGSDNSLSLAGVEDTLRKASSYAQKQWCPDQLIQGQRNLSSCPAVESTIPISALILGSSGPLDALSIVDWTEGTSSLPVRVTRLDAGHMFKGLESTYWIVGMSGALGISLAEWMISRGARSLVITSRAPDLDPEWIASHKRCGAAITIVACDVTDEAALKEAHAKICSTLPPITGVIHGAMVLRDVAISNMSFNQLVDVISPKVNGSVYLDRIFRDVDLDFFVLTSSINTVIGNRGQANYAAANAFMCSLAAQRRKRGLRAAAVNGGAIIGAGYMERDSRRTWDRIAQNNGMMRLSEDDFVQSVCEGIEASRLDSHGPEISTGLDFVSATANNPPFWVTDPKFSAFIVHEKAGSSGNEQDKTANSATRPSIQYLLQQCTSEEEVYETVKHAFANTLCAILQLNMSEDDLMGSRSNAIGLDSLVSVNIRSWFLKHLQVNMPVFKIMSNETMEHLVQFAVGLMPKELVPQLHEIHPNAAQRDVESPVDRSLPISDTSSVTTSAGLSTSFPSTPETPPSNSSMEAQRGTSIDWEAESRPPTYLSGIPLATDLPAVATPPRTIVLTGASGLFGSHLLTFLVEHKRAQRVICIAVRDLSRRLENGELPLPSTHIVYYEGDLAAPLLGLSPDEAASIFASADAVIHNGADTSHMKSYMDMKTSNVGSTVELIRLCLPRRVPLHYVSSAGLAILYGQDTFPPVSVTGPGCALPAADGSFGYASTKWVCESLLERAHALYSGSWFVCIHRPSTIIREGVDSVGEKAELDWVNAMLQYAKKYKTVPRIRRNRGALDLVFVQNACAALVARVVQPGEGMEVSYVHEVGDRVIPLDRLQDIGLHEDEDEDEDEQRPFDIVPLAEWAGKAVADGLHPAVVALVEMMDEPGGRDYPRLLKE
ncbi:putative polyketide synthase [Hypoxylon sp. FL1857]|nr:putative polyketide synthase [Hypoxylon sp. FL1857]